MVEFPTRHVRGVTDVESGVFDLDCPGVVDGRDSGPKSPHDERVPGGDRHPQVESQAFIEVGLHGFSELEGGDRDCRGTGSRILGALGTESESNGAGDGNRTRITSLEGWGSAIELHP